MENNLFINRVEINMFRNISKKKTVLFGSLWRLFEVETAVSPKIYKPSEMPPPKKNEIG